MGQILDHHGNVFLFQAQLILQRQQIAGCQRFQLIELATGTASVAKASPWDRIPQRTAAEIHQTQVKIRRMGEQNARQQFVAFPTNVNITTE